MVKRKGFASFIGVLAVLLILSGAAGAIWQVKLRTAQLAEQEKEPGVESSAYTLAKELSVDMPITEQLYQVIRGTVKGPDAVANLMLRKRRHESDD